MGRAPAKASKIAAITTGAEESGKGSARGLARVAHNLRQGEAHEPNHEPRPHGINEEAKAAEGRQRLQQPRRRPKADDELHGQQHHTCEPAIPPLAPASRPWLGAAVGAPFCAADNPYQALSAGPIRPYQALSGRGAAGEFGIIVEHRGEPALGFLEAPSLAPRVVGCLIALDLADAEVVAVGMGEIEAADAGAWPHRVAFGQA